MKIKIKSDERLSDPRLRASDVHGALPS